MKKHAAQESGAALIVAMMLMLVLAIMLIGFFFVTEGEQKVAASNVNNEVTYYWAVAGLEQMSDALADFFAYTAAPTPTSITNWATNSVNFAPYPTTISTSGLPSVTSTYTLYCWPPQTPGPCTTTPNLVLCSTVSGNVLGSCTGTIGGNGPLAGLQGVITPFRLTVTADGPNNTEVRLNRVVQEVAVPIFEFGIFSDSDLSFYAGPTFDFGGRVHTNGNLFLAQDDGNTLILNDHVTAAKGIIRDQISNGFTMATYPNTCSSYTNNYCAYVNVLTTAGGCPATATGLLTTGNCLSLGINQGSIENGPGSTENPNWGTISGTTYNGFIQDSQTGGKVLNIAIALPGISAQPIAMLQRPPSSESPTSVVGMARFFNQASVRILLSDTASAITSLQGIDNTVAPYPLAEVNSASGYPTLTGSGNYTIQRNNSSNNYYLPLGDGCHPPLAQAPAENATNDYMLPANTTTLGGYIKIEMQCAATANCASTWKDVTQEILAQGISRDVGPGTAIAAATLALASNGSLTAGTTYYYTVTATNAYGETVGTQTSGLTTTSTKDTIALSWTAVTGASGYNIYRTTTSGTYTGTGNGYIASTTGTTYTDGGATANGSGPPPSSCTNNSIIHLEEAAAGVSLTASTWSALTPTNFVPINMYDSREGELRDSSTATTPSLNGIMNLVEVDVHNLQQWFAGNIATSGKWAFNGPDALNNGGYILYTSDRRMNCYNNPSATNQSGTYAVEGDPNSSCVETAEFGNEDIINPSDPNGTPNGQLDTCTTGVTACPPEDIDGDGVFRTYGAYAHPIAAPTSVTPSGQTNPWNTIITSLADTATNPAMVRITVNQAQANSVVIFRRGLRLVNGTLGNLPPVTAAQATTCSGGTAGGFTVVSENPIYVLGDYNASVANGYNDVSGKCHVPAAVMGDAVTLLSNNWAPGAQSGHTSGDYNSFLYPAASACNNRCATTTYYRMAVMGGKTNSFPEPSWGKKDTGTDGGVQNFLRYLEDWSNIPLYYLGSLTSFYMARQGAGIFKDQFNSTVYKPPVRNFTFDVDFQSISKLPPGTPRFTDVNALSYYQSVMYNQ